MNDYIPKLFKRTYGPKKFSWCQEEFIRNRDHRYKLAIGDIDCAAEQLFVENQMLMLSITASRDNLVNDLFGDLKQHPSFIGSSFQGDICL